MQACATRTMQSLCWCCSILAPLLRVSKTYLVEGTHFHCVFLVLSEEGVLYCGFLVLVGGGAGVRGGGGKGEFSFVGNWTRAALYET